MLTVTILKSSLPLTVFEFPVYSIAQYNKTVTNTSTCMLLSVIINDLASLYISAVQFLQHQNYIK